MRTLVIAESGDRVADRICERGHDIVRRSGFEFFSGSRFACLQDGGRIEGSIAFADQHIDFQELRAVLFRPGSDDSQAPASPHAQTFLRHETRAAGCALLAALPCPVVNRFGPAWWFDTALHDDWLTATFAEASAVPMATLGQRHVASASTAQAQTAYLMEGRIVASSDPLDALRTRLVSRASQVIAWSTQTGVGFAAIEYVLSPAIVLKRVDPTPTLKTVDTSLFNTICAHLESLLA